MDLISKLEKEIEELRNNLLYKERELVNIKHKMGTVCLFTVYIVLY